MSQLADLKLLAKPKIAKTITTGTTQHANLHVATDTRLIESHGAVQLEVAFEVVLHLGEISLIETGLQQENGRKGSVLSEIRDFDLI